MEGGTLEEYRWFTEQIVDWSEDNQLGPRIILDDFGDATTLVHGGVEFEKEDKIPKAANGDLYQ